MLVDEEIIACVKCGSDEVIKHGTTNNGGTRMRCKSCQKTWTVNKLRPPKPDINILTEMYLLGATVRDIVPLYNSSPHRINQKIRKSLTNSPNWEDYLDSTSTNKYSDIVYLLGKSFACNYHGEGIGDYHSSDTSNNSMYMAIAVDGLSSMIIGYEVGISESPQVWNNLFGRLAKRGYNSKSFMSNGNDNILDAVQKYFPSSEATVNVFRMHREKEIECCLSKLPLKHKLVNDAFRYYNTLNNQTLQNTLKNFYKMDMREALMGNFHNFIESVNKKSIQKTLNRVDCLAEDFKARFEKFHMIKDDPRPIINGWIALKMLEKLDFGYNRLSLYNQKLLDINFINFTKNKVPLQIEVNNFDELKPFIIEIGSRVLNLPLNIERCDLNLRNCEHLSYLYH